MGSLLLQDKTQECQERIDDAVKKSLKTLENQNPSGAVTIHFTLADDKHDPNAWMCECGTCEAILQDLGYRFDMNKKDTIGDVKAKFHKEHKARNRKRRKRGDDRAKPVIAAEHI